MAYRYRFLAAGIVFVLVPVIQRCLGTVIQGARLLMEHLDSWAFGFAKKLHSGD